MAPEKTFHPVVVYTRHHRVEGTLTLLKGERFSDKLNAPGCQFEILSEARVYSLDGSRLVHEAPYLALNKDHVVMMIPA